MARPLALAVALVLATAFVPVARGEEGTAQLLAGNVDADGAAVPGYLDWLGALGLDGTGVQVSIVDSGIDELHPDLEGRVVGKLDYTGLGEESVDDQGHGSHVAGIVAATGATADLASDDRGLAYGLGMAPGTALFDQNAVSLLAGGTGLPVSPIVLADAIPEIARDAIRAGSVAWNASWTTGEGAGSGYIESARAVDTAVRDADPETPGDQPLIMVFSAGNSGPGPRTLTPPHEAKNVIVTASSDTPRLGDPEGISSFSSRGPARDGRLLPNVTAPGGAVVSVRATVSPPCEPPVDPPSVPSPLHAVCSGTSMAAPHVTGAVALLTQWWRGFNGGGNPSPAMAKALLVNTARDLGDADVPNEDEGWGRIDTGELFAPGAQRVYLDQTAILAAPGETRTLELVPADPSRPVRATLTWTDLPGTAFDPANEPEDPETLHPKALVNDLDLAVERAGTAYLGNVFEDGRSVPGGAPDRLNNVENVWLPAGAGPLRVTVSAAALSGAQDFALVVSNAEAASAPGAGPGASGNAPTVRLRWRGKRIRRLVVRDVPAGATVRVRCRGKRCPRGRVTRTFPAAVAKARFTKRVRRWRPRRVVVRVTGVDPVVRRAFKRPRRG